MLDNFGTIEKLLYNSGMELEILFNLVIVFSIIWGLGSNLTDINNKTSMAKQS